MKKPRSNILEAGSHRNRICESCRSRSKDGLARIHADESRRMNYTNSFRIRGNPCYPWQLYGSACGPVIVPVFKTGGRQVFLSPVGSTPTRFRHFSTTYRHANQLQISSALVDGVDLRAGVPGWRSVLSQGAGGVSGKSDQR